MPANRIVALFTPVIALAAGGAATWLADHVPGMNVSPGELQAVFIAGIAAIVAPAAQWLHGAQKFEAHQQELDQAALQADAQVASPPLEQDVAAAAYDGYDDDDYDDDDYDDDDDGGGDDGTYVDDDYVSARDEAEPTAATVGA